jgi:hypothetical protein
MPDKTSRANHEWRYREATYFNKWEKKGKQAGNAKSGESARVTVS